MPSLRFSWTQIAAMAIVAAVIVPLVLTHNMSSLAAVLSALAVAAGVLAKSPFPTPPSAPEDAPTKPVLPRDPPSVPSILFLVGVTIFGSRALAGCSSSGAQSPARDTARAAVLLVAEGVRVADETCARAGASAKDGELLKACADGYDVTRAALLSAEAGIDAWDAGDHRDFACAIAAAVRGLAHLSNAVTEAGVQIPPLVTDALTLGAGFAGGACR